MATLKFVLRTEKMDKAGKCPLYMRLTKNRKTRFLSTGVKLLQNQWDEETQKVKKNYPNSTRMNAILAVKMADASILTLEEEKRSNNPTAQQIKDALLGVENVDFFEYQKKVFTRLKTSLSVSSMYNYNCLIEKFKGFVGDRTLFLQDITVTLIKDYIYYLTTVKSNNTSSIKTCLIPLAKIFNSAIEDGLIDKNLYPFDKITLKVVKQKRNFLTTEQLEKFKNHKYKESKNTKLTHDMFMFAISAGGLRFSDVVTLRWRDINFKDATIERKIRKTKRKHRLKMGLTAFEIISRYKPDLMINSNFVFPALKQSRYDNGDLELRRKMISSSNALCNIHLRKIGKEMELPFTLHFHLSRHTFATTALNNGMRIEHVSKLMDHSKISTTQIYANILDEELDKAVDAFII